MNTTQRRHIAEAVRTARLRKGWTTTEAAARLQTSDANWSRWETASATPRPATLLRLGELLDLPEGWWEVADETLSHPTATVDPDELLERIRAELAEHERRIAEMLTAYTKEGNTDGTTPLGNRQH